MSQPQETESTEPAPVHDPAQAWEARRKAWLQPNEHGKRRATQATVDRLKAVVHASPSDRASKVASDRIVLGIKARLASKDGLKEPMPLPLMVSLLYKSWLLDGTIDAKMLKDGRAATDDEKDQQNKQKG